MLLELLVALEAQLGAQRSTPSAEYLRRPSATSSPVPRRARCAPACRPRKTIETEASRARDPARPAARRRWADGPRAARLLRSRAADEGDGARVHPPQPQHHRRRQPRQPPRHGAREVRARQLRRRNVSLAAQDYFFEGQHAGARPTSRTSPTWRRCSRGGSLRQRCARPGSCSSKGKTVLIFPEGTRSTDGHVHEFKSAVGHLALHHDVDILPVYLGGTYAALPKGARCDPAPRRRGAHRPAARGAPSSAPSGQGLSTGGSARAASRACAARRGGAEPRRSARHARRSSRNSWRAAVEVGPAVARARFRELEQRFVAGSVEQPISFYFSLGDSERWTVRVTERRCEVSPGKVAPPADCVLKTTPDMFTRIVRERYTPSPAEFMSGTVKSNNIRAAVHLQKVSSWRARTRMSDQRARYPAPVLGREARRAFSGSHLVRRLRSAVTRCRRCRVAAASVARRRRRAVDVLDADAVAESARGCDGGFLATGKVRALARTRRKSCTATTCSAPTARSRVCARAGMKRVVVASTSGTLAVSRDADSIADESCRAAARDHRALALLSHQAVRRTRGARSEQPGDFEVVVVNPSLLLGPGDLRESSTGDVRLF